MRGAHLGVQPDTEVAGGVGAAVGADARAPQPRGQARAVEYVTAERGCYVLREQLPADYTRSETHS